MKGVIRLKKANLIKRLGERIGPFSAKKAIIAIICILCFTLPTTLALSLIFADDSEYTRDSLSITLYDSENLLIAEETASPDPEKRNSLVDIFYHIIKDSSPLDATPTPSEEVSPMYATVVLNGSKSEYVCYFLFTEGASYYTDESGKAFAISPAAAMDFLLSPYAESLYSKASPPKLFSNLGVTVIPSSASWFYRMQNNSYREAMNYETTNEAICYDFSRVLDITFESEPDESIARVFENGMLIYEGDESELSSLTIGNGSSLRINISAKWKEHDGVLFHGDVTYSFNANLCDRSEFSLNGDTITQGGFLVLNCTNVDDISKIRFSSDTDFSPRFSLTGDTVTALIPYPNDTEKDSFDFSVAYGASEKKFSVKLEKSSNDKTYILASSSENAANAMSESSVSEAMAIIKEIAKNSEDTVYFQGNLSSPILQNFVMGYGYGYTVISANNEISLKAFGNEYLSVSDGQTVKTLCSGRVVATGHCIALGNYVAVDHGLGLISWYCHLSSLDTCDEKTLAINDSVGKSGNGGFADANGVLILVTLNGEFLDPSFLMK